RRRRLNVAIAEAEVELTKVEQAYTQVKRLEGVRPEELAVRAITTYPGVEELHSKIVAKLGEGALLEARYKEKHPRAIAFSREFEALTVAFVGKVRQASSELENSAEGLGARIVDLRGKLAAAEGEVLALGDKSIEQTMLRSQLQADRSLYDKMVVRLNEASVSSQLKEASHLRMSETAVAAEKAVSPNVPLATVLAGMVFCGLFIGLPVVVGMGEDLVRRGRIGGGGDGGAGVGGELSEAVPVLGAGHVGGAGIAVLGEIPELAVTEGVAKEVVAANGLGAVFDSLATEIESRVAGASERQVYLVTSEAPGSGKSLVAAGLGLALGAQGKKTLVLDANLRSPAMERMFEAEGMQGVAPWLASGGVSSFDLEELRQPGSSLYVLPAGVVDEAPGSLLARECFARMMAGAVSSFDRVIVDASAAEGCPELFALLPHVGGVIAVTDRSGGGAALEVEGLVSRLGLGAGRLVGMVVNRAAGLAVAA
ncbi:MAG: hypothetical protein P8J87_00105, partial [Verrucomicrobiales bacterium]|nr:hypothetical protein [Verrucomicrobiales bacterium]